MKKTNKFLSLVVVFTMIISLFSIQTVFAFETSINDEPDSEQTFNNTISPAAISTIVIDGITYELDDTTYTAKTIGYSGLEKNVVIPDSIPDSGNEYMVTTIGANTFNGKGLESVEIPDGVITIGAWAFAHNKLTSVEIPDSVITIERDAFADGTLENVKISDNVITIGAWAFGRNKLESVEIPDSVTTIGASAFAFNLLENVEISNSVTTIESDTFANNLLESVEIPDSVTIIGPGAFKDNQLESMGIPDSVTTIGAWAFAHNKLTSVEIPDSVTTIGLSAFAYNKLTNVEIPDSVTIIGVAAFENNLLTSVEIPASVTSIGNYAFSGNPLVTIFVPKLVDVPNVVAVLDANAMRQIAAPYTSMYALDNNNIQGDYIAGTPNQCTLEYGQTQDLTVGEIYSPEVKRHDNSLSTWQDPEDNPIAITDVQVEWYNQSDTLVGTGHTFTASETGTYHAVVNGILELRTITVDIKANQPTKPEIVRLPKTGEPITSLQGLMLLLLGSSMLGITVLKKHKDNDRIK